MKQDDTVRAMIKAAIKKGMRDIEFNPRMGVGELIHSGSHFAKSDLQKEFFAIAQTLLLDDDSLYYPLIDDLITLTDHETIMNYGINLGYNSWICGARKLRQYSAVFSCHIPWAIVFDFTLDTIHGGHESMDLEDIISQGRSLGIYTYIIHGDKNTGQDYKLLSAIHKYTDCAFLLFLDPGICTREFVREITREKNAMISLNCDTPQWMDALKILREEQSLAGIHLIYNDNTVSDILSGEKMKEAEENHCHFMFFIRDDSCSGHTWEAVHKYMKDLRPDLSYPVFPFHFYDDLEFVDGLVSGRCSPLAISKDGNIFMINNKKTDYNINEDSLIRILMGLE